MNKLMKLNLSLWNVIFSFGAILSILASIFSLTLIGLQLFSNLVHSPSLSRSINVNVSGIAINSSIEKLIVLLFMLFVFIILFKTFKTSRQIILNIKLSYVFSYKNLELLKQILIYITVITSLLISLWVIILLITHGGSNTLIKNITNIVIDTLLFNSFIFLLYTIFKYGLDLKNDADLLI